MQDAALKRLGELFSEQETHGNTPKYRKVFHAIVQTLHEGTLAPGDRLPNEADVAESLPVSLGTVQKAMSKLSESGLVTRSRRNGTFVRDWQSRSEDALIYRFTDPRTGRPHPPSTKALSVSRDEPPGPWRSTLGHTAIIRFERLVWVEAGSPAYSEVFLPFDYAKHMLDVPLEQLHGTSYHRILSEAFSLPPTRIEEKISCAVLMGAACDHLRLKRGTTGIIWDATEFYFDERPLVFQRIQLPPGHRPIEISRNVPIR